MRWLANVMNRKQFSIEFPDADTGEQAYIGLRAIKGMIGLCLSLEDGSDVEIFMAPEICEKLAAGLRKAIARSQQMPPE
jgi:hypothetical protein